MVGPRWGRKLVICRSDSDKAWYAREDLQGGDPVIFSLAIEINAAIEIGAASIKECVECGLAHKVHRSDDYRCIECRDDPWLHD
jgi:hypothetical protein